MRTWTAAVLTATVLAATAGGVGLTAVADAAATTPAWTTPLAFSVPTDTTVLAVGPTGHTVAVAPTGLRDLTPTGPGLSFGLHGNVIAFLPNGDSVVNDASYGGSSLLTYRFADGHLGGSIHVYGGIDGFAANGNELLTVSGWAVDGVSGLGATSWAIDTDTGTFTQNGPIVPIYSGPTFGTWVALDANGEADVALGAYLNNYDTIAVVDVRRLVTGGIGTWQTPRVVDGNISNGLVGGVSPTGQIVLAWDDAVDRGSLGWSEPHLYAAVRQPGQAMGARQTLLSQGLPASGFAELLDVKAAAGPDGTVAVAARTWACADEQASTTAAMGASVWVAKPGTSALSASSVPGATGTKTHRAEITALGAGHGQAIVGLHQTDLTKDTSGTYNLAYCASTTITGSQSFSYSDSAFLTGIGSHTFGTGQQSNGPSGTSSFSDVKLTAASIDTVGNAAVLGTLTDQNTVTYSMYDTGVAPYPTTAPTSPTGPSPTTPAPTTSAPTTAPTTQPALGGGGATTAPLPTAPPIQRPATTTTVAVPDLTTNAQTIWNTNTTTGIENVSMAEYAYASGLTTSAPHVQDGKPKLVTVAAGKVRVGPHKKVAVKLKLSAAAWKALRAKGKLVVTLKITTTEPGYATKTVTKTITLKYKKPKKH